MAYRKSGTRDPYMGRGTRDPPPESLCLGSGTQDPVPLFGTHDLGPSTWDPLPGTWDRICGNLDPIPLRAMRDSYLGTLTLMQLSFF